MLGQQRQVSPVRFQKGGRDDPAARRPAHHGIRKDTRYELCGWATGRLARVQKEEMFSQLPECCVYVLQANFHSTGEL